VVSVLISAGFLAVIFRLVDIMVVNHQWFSERAKMQHIKREAFPVKRGIIADRKGRELAVNLETESVYCDPKGITSPDKVAQNLSHRIGQESDVLLTKLTSEGRFKWIERKLAIQEAQKIKDMRLQGIGFISEPKRFYPKGALASHIVGFVNIDNNGLEGVERFYEQYLTTTGESTYLFRDAKGNVYSESLTREIKGNNVVLTIDEGLQYILEKNLDAALAHWKAASATAVMLDPSTGGVLAMASRPTFDPNNPSEVSAEQRRNRAITDFYEPGSTFKIIVGTAVLEEHLVKLDTKFDCSAGSVEVGGRRIKDAHRHGVLTYKEVIQKSSNVGSIKLGLLLGKERMYEYIKRFGFGEKTGIDLDGEVAGRVRAPERWSGMSIGAITIGQEIAVTPLQLVRAYAAIANGGYLVKPHVVAEVKSPEGVVLYKAKPEMQRVLSEKTAQTFQEILKTVTEEGGTAKSAAVDGNDVAGKTGTAQKVDPKTKQYSKEKYVSSFVGFVPAQEPRMVLVVVIHEPRGHIYGGVVAAPVFREIAREALSYLNVPRDDSQEKGLLLVSHN
jgi:cell division protein FtsI (penicillin-binding protein 3)